MDKVINEITALFASFEKDAKALAQKGNKSAGVRARRATIELNKLMKEYRKVSIDYSKEL